MFRVGRDSYDWKTMDRIDVTNFHKISAKRNVRMASRNVWSSGESSCSVDGSTPSSDFGVHRLSLEEAGRNFARFGEAYAMRKASTCSETSSTNSGCLCLDGGCPGSDDSSSCCHVDREDEPTGGSKYDDIIDKIMELRFSRKNLYAKAKDAEEEKSDENENAERSTRTEDSSNGHDGNEATRKSPENAGSIEIDDVNGNYEVSEKVEDSEDSEDSEDDDDELVQRGPVRPNCNGRTRHGKPYYTLDWLAGTNRNIDRDEAYTFDYDSTAERILRNKQFSDKLNPCLDKLSDYGRSRRTYFTAASEETRNGDFQPVSGWSSPEVNYAETGTPGSNASGDDAGNNPIASTVPNEPEEAALLEMLASGGFQAARSLSDTASVQNRSPGGISSEHWPDSPASSYNVLSSRSHSRGSSPARSPCSSANIGSPMLHLNVIGSPTYSRSNLRCSTAGQALSSSESSNHSFGETPSPSNYQCGIDHRLEEQLGSEFGKFPTWYQNCLSSSTLVDSAETINAIDSNELQLVEEVIRRDQRHKRNIELAEDAQVVPKSYSLEGAYGADKNCPEKVGEQDFSSDRMRVKDKCERRSTTNPAVPSGQQLFSQLREQPAEVAKTEDNHQLVCPGFSDAYRLTLPDCMSAAPGLMNFENSMDKLLASAYDRSSTSQSSPTKMDGPGGSDVPSETAGTSAPFYDEPPTTTPPGHAKSRLAFDEFQIPETVATYRQNRSRRTSGRTAAPWASLNLPRTSASEMLKADLDPVKVENAMRDLLKRPSEELAAGDEEGDSALMCLLGNPAELEKKKAFLVPLVERVSRINGALTMTNIRGEDALYLAAKNNPHVPYVTGYLAAAMVQKGINISRILYHTRGDTLIHAIAAEGDTHVGVLAELLSLKTAQGNSVFDLSQRNYYGRTALHLAVESHDPANSGVSCIRTTQVLLENGADLKIEEPNCGDTVLHTAVSLSADPALLKVLLQINDWEAVNLPNYNNDTPLHMAAALSGAVTLDRQINICTDLIFAGAQTNVLNLQGQSPLALVSPDRREAIEYLFHEKTMKQFPEMNFNHY